MTELSTWILIIPSLFSKVLYIVDFKQTMSLTCRWAQKRTGRARDTRQRKRSLFQSVSLSRAPFFPARYFQAPTTRVKDQAIIGKNGLLNTLV